ncbi:MAG TPA: asparagine synthase (glutamine-hydrolyzing) [Thermoleophilaceae bacterium]|nr:asparagine synthase (glutamine-hydrolyzing) [Thermoleophilaceae bacterium]
MCGIVGVFEHGRSRGGVTPDLVIRMRETLHHRGPDGEGLFVTEDGRLGFGHRRLSIVDLEAGAQPMFDAAGACLVFNGEIYNYPALRRELEADGVRFRTHCDTEVILHLYRRYGERCVDHMTGMFAFALWDPDRDEVFFARDPIGEKPLYWADRDGTFLFGSEIKAILEHPLAPRAVNEDAIGPYLANLVTPGPETLYRGINKLAPGHAGRCGRDGVRTWRYWSAAEPRAFADVGDEAVDRVRELLDKSIHDRLMSDVPVGVLLSGGMDSSTVVALLREQARGLASFTVGFPGYEDVDERREARWVAERFGTDHHEVTLSETDALGMLGPLIHHQDEPLADPVCIPLHAVCRLARENGIKVVLAGEGADELFWGYHGYHGALERWRLHRAALAAPRVLRRLAAAVTSPRTAPLRREQLEGFARGRLKPIHCPVGMTRHQRASLLLSGDEDVGWGPTAGIDGEDPLTTLGFDTQEYEFQVRLPELLLMRIDRFSMANSVEARVPFLDPALVDYVYRLPLSSKIRDGVTKWALKEAVADVVPPEVSQRRKQGFGAPTSRWFLGRHGSLLRDLMGQDTLRRYFDIPYLDSLLAGANPDSWEAGQILWPVLNFGLWHKHWIEGEPLDEIVERASADPHGAAPALA